MLTKHLAEKIYEKLNHKPTNSQVILINLLSEYVLTVDYDSIFLVRGYAGTGKTTVISALVQVFEEIKQKTVLLAPTGRAAKILTQYSGKQAFTIHKKIYRQVSSKDGFGKFTLDKNLHTNTLFIVDEASMISNESGESSFFGSGKLLDDLIEYVYTSKNCKLIFIGDIAQLPPVGLIISPALNPEILKGYLLSLTECDLTEVVRQSAKSGILENATTLRLQINNGRTELPKFNVKNFNDIERLNASDLIEKINESYEKSGIEQTIIISRSNKRANQYNTGIRNQILYRDEPIAPGDLLMVVKNNYYWLGEDSDIDFIANGDIIEILKIRKYHEMYGYRFADVKLKMIDYDIELESKIIVDTLTIDSASLTTEQNKNLFYSVYEDYSDLQPKKKGYNMVRENPYFNALQVKFAYAVTCHKAQGGQWKTIFIDQGYIKENSVNIEYLRWLYTALTRATEKVYLINFPDSYFT